MSFFTQVLQNSYAYKIEYRPGWTRDRGTDEILTYYSNDISLRLVEKWYGHGLEITLKDAAFTSQYSRRQHFFDYSGATLTYDAPLEFRKNDHYFIRVTRMYDGSIIVDTVPSTNTE